MRPIVALALVTSTLVGCASCRAMPVDPDDLVDASLEDACFRACLRLETLGCPEALPTDAGATCVTICRDTEASGVVSLEPECVANATSCDDVDRCFLGPQ